MAQPVAHTEVLAHVERYGPLASLVTVAADGRPHVGTVLVAERDGRLVVHVGSRTRDNIAANPRVSLTWIRDDLDYQLILDGTAEVADEPDGEGQYPTTIAVDHGILHRLAGRPDAGPSCQPLSVEVPEG